MKVYCPALLSGKYIPNKYAHRTVTGGQNVSLPVHWGDVPAGTRSFVFSVIDRHPSAKSPVHWFVINVPHSVREIPEHASGLREKMPPASLELPNSSAASGTRYRCPRRTRDDERVTRSPFMRSGSTSFGGGHISTSRNAARRWPMSVIRDGRRRRNFPALLAPRPSPCYCEAERRNRSEAPTYTHPLDFRRRLRDAGRRRRPSPQASGVYFLLPDRLLHRVVCPASASRPVPPVDELFLPKPVRSNCPDHLEIRDRTPPHLRDDVRDDVSPSCSV